MILNMKSMLNDFKPYTYISKNKIGPGAVLHGSLRYLFENKLKISVDIIRK